ncbi:MAG TPA: ankyrin repeat domain-containing protein [Tepidisphaeraceae bacterium]|nr:ankyrin repeat domain-containing protein [Tepidisphaeraceae bacterium]
MLDTDLLRQFVDTRSHDAMARLVHAYAPVVYSACLRQLRDPVLVDRGCRAAFALLAREAPRLTGRRTLLPFVYEAACHAAAAVRALPEAQGNPALGAPAGGPAYTGPADWANLSPRIDPAMMTLRPAEREAVLLKYLAGLSLRDAADTLGLEQQELARRCAAGVARLRTALAGENQYLSAEALVAAVQAHAIRPAADSAISGATAAALEAGDAGDAPAADGTSPRGIAAGISADLKRARVMSAGVTTAAAVLLAGAAVMLVAKLRDVAVAASTQPTPAVVDSPPVSGDGRDSKVVAAATTTRTTGPSTTQAAVPDAPPREDLKRPPEFRRIGIPVRPVEPAQAALFAAAVRAGDLDVVRGMVAANPDLVNATDPATRRPILSTAAELVDWQRRDSTRVAHYLIDHDAQLDPYTCARAGHKLAVHFVLAHNAHLVEAADPASGLTVLQCAALIPGASPECENVVEFLIENGVHVDLFTACTFARGPTVRQRLADDPKLVSARAVGATPLHWAVRPRRFATDPLEIPKMLLDAGADARARDFVRDGVTPLHDAAAWADQPAVVQFLLDKGVPVNEADDLGWTALDYATSRGRAEVVTLLEGKGGKRTTVAYDDLPLKTGRFLQALRAGEEQGVAVLLGDTPELAMTRGPTGETPLHLAAAAGHRGIVDLLIKEKADVNAAETNRFGGTPLHWAARQGRADMVWHLLEKGADAKAVNRRTGQTALHVAARHGDDADLAKVLLERGADPAVKDKLGNTAADYAKRFENAKVAEALK